MGKNRRPPLALCYHGIGTIPPKRDSSLLFVAPSHLIRHIRILRHWGYRFVTFSELATRAAHGRANNLVALTFDDGLIDNLTVLAPLLRSEQIPATAFVIAGWSGQRHPDAPWTRTMTPDELRALAGAGFEIGGHSMNHQDLSQLPQERAAADMRACRELLEGALERPVTAFAYPFGKASTETVAACATAGYRCACRSYGGQQWGDPFNLPRQAMVNGASRLGLWLKRDDRYERVMQTVPGRAARRAARVARSARMRAL